MPISKQRFALVVILVISTFLNVYRLDQIGINGIGNPYYAAAVQSMLTSTSNFFYLSVDPAGFVSLDKPPLAFWIQAASAWVLSFHGLSMLLPEAIAGIIAAYALYLVVRRAYGEWAGLLAALVLAVTPISVVTNRNNAPDALLVLTVLLAAWTLLRAVEDGSRRWLFVTAILVSLAFNIKMLQILLVLPALIVLYLVAAPWNWRTRLLNAAWAVLVALLTALPWVVAVELTPRDQRPYIGGSMNNTVVDLIFGYNGIARLWGEDFTYYSGLPSPLRLFNDKLGGQVGWLLPFALIGLMVAVWQSKSRERQNALILWTTWLAVPMIYFSVSTFFHRYYLATLAPAIAALVGISADALWNAWRTGGKQRAWMIIALLGCAVVQVMLLLPFPEWSIWLIPIVAIASLAAIVISMIAQRKHHDAGQRAAFVTGIVALLIAPTLWTLIPVFTCTDYTLPYGGPQVVGAKCKSPNVRPFFDREWVDALERGRNGARFLAATHDMGIAELGILGTREPFMALGGFRGSDPILTVGQFADRVARGDVRYYQQTSNCLKLRGRA